MEKEIPAPSENHGEYPPNASPILKGSFEDFKAFMQGTIAEQKKKGTAMKRAKARNRLASHVNHCEALKRGQRYLGLRPLDCKDGLPVPDASLSWDAQQTFEREQKIKYGHNLHPLDLEKRVPHLFDRDVVFISVDVEAYERNHGQIMEVGISTLDTADIKPLAPGHSGFEWMKHIRSRHLRIVEHRHLQNTTFCFGDPKRFLFGLSEFFSMDDVGTAIDSCFQPPYSADFVHDGTFKAEEENVALNNVADKLQDHSIEQQKTIKAGVPSFKLSTEPVDVQGPSNTEQDEANKVAVSNILPPCELPEKQRVADPGVGASRSSHGLPVGAEKVQGPQSKSPKPRYRNIILVGHDLDADLNYLSSLKSAIFTNPPINTYPQPLEPENHLRKRILESLDTATLYKVWKRETNITSLAKVLMGVEKTGWGLHNAGNDARYTMEALVGILVRSRVEEDEVTKAASGDEEMGLVIEKKRREEEDELRMLIQERQAAVEREERENAAMRRYAVGAYGSEGQEDVLPDPYVPTSAPGTLEAKENEDIAVPNCEKPAAGLSAPCSEDAATLSSDTEKPLPSLAKPNSTTYSWSTLPTASRDGGEPKGFKMPTPKKGKSNAKVEKVNGEAEKAKSEDGRLNQGKVNSEEDDIQDKSPRPLDKERQHILQLQADGEISGPAEFMPGARPGW
jgi:hypothetical protein